jgi:SPP1 gp7 family putative phage head morphogenesis protein
MALNKKAFQELILKRRALGIQKKKLGRLPKILHPTPIERQYSRALVAIAKNIQTQTEKILLSGLEDVIAERDRAILKTDGVRLDGWADDAQRLIDSLKMTLENTVLYRPSRLASDIGQKTSAWNNVQWRKTMKSVLGVDFFQREPWLSDIMKSFEKENVGLIKSITDQAVNNIEGMVHRGVTNGDRFTKIQKQIQNQFDVTKNRARLIARDQVSKLNGQITMTRQQSLGIERYVWSTSLDERVRGNPAGKYPNSQYDHWEREGKEFSWNDPPPDGHPGQPINCRCVALPVIKDLEDLVQ